MVLGLDDPLPYPAGKGEFSLLQGVQRGSGAHPAALHSMGTRGLPPGVKRSGREADHSPPGTE